MSEKTNGSSDPIWFTEGLISAISAGLFFVLIGVIFVINLNLWQRILDFAKDFTTVQIAHTTTYLPVPASPAAHTAVYSAVFQFALGIGILQILILALRLTMGSRIRRTSQTVGDLVFWFGAAYMLNILANMKTTLTHSQQLNSWFQFWSAIILIIGLSIIARAIVLFYAEKRSPVKHKTP